MRVLTRLTAKQAADPLDVACLRRSARPDQASLAEDELAANIVQQWLNERKLADLQKSKGKPSMAV